ncbi:PREDICTED: F-box protein At2g26160-like [Prunus mume]|uniref:F-box protein At2g26160-like n=1 Tax=Prunus mume TaxID=102107 RepID=A0ABM0P4M3_PRUMU|nr:PREDICTED: F-box protein At2g26160-like [Prunus mume]
MEDAPTLVSGWAWLPSNILDLILEKLIPISDYIRFSAVCKHWQSVAIHRKKQPIKSCHKQIPMLIIPTIDGSSERRGLYCVTQGKTCSFELNVYYSKRFCGSSHGWLACVDENLVVTLLNPFTGHTISLPPVPKSTWRSTLAYRCDYYINKVVLSADPSFLPNDYEVLVIYDGFGKQIAHFKSGDDAWTSIDQVIGFDDVIYYKGQFLGVSLGGSVFSMNVSRDPTIKPHVSLLLPMDPGTDNKTYLVQSSQGELLLVRKFKRVNYCKRFMKSLNFKFFKFERLKFERVNGYGRFTETLSFKVFKLFCAHGERPQWVEIESIGNEALFLGTNQSMCVSALDFPGCQPNSIYFTDDCVDVECHKPKGPHDMGTFNLENRSMGTHYCLDSLQKHMPPAIWILPSMV